MTDMKAFRRVCFEAALRTGGKVIEFRLSAGVTPNFHKGVIAYVDRTAAVVWSRGTPLLALATPRVIDTPGRELGPLTFLDHPDLATVLAETTEFHVLSATQLNGPIDEATRSRISPHDLRYWQPQTLGECLFNYWD